MREDSVDLPLGGTSLAFLSMAMFVLNPWGLRCLSAHMTPLSAAVPDQVSVNAGAPSADGQRYITSRSLLQSNGGPSYWTVTIHAGPANAETVRAQVAQLAAMPAQQLAGVLRSHGEATRSFCGGQQLSHIWPTIKRSGDV